MLKVFFPEFADRHMKDIQQAMLLLAFPFHAKKFSKVTMKKHAMLWDPARWTELVSQFRRNCFVLNSSPPHSLLSTSLQCGLAALKTPQCCSDQHLKSKNCPVCSSQMTGLVSNLPCARQINSKLVCFISGEEMNEYNPPLMLPNGYVYGSKALLEQSNRHGGKISCPRTGLSFNLSDTQKVFVM